MKRELGPGGGGEVRLDKRYEMVRKTYRCIPYLRYAGVRRRSAIMAL